MSSLFEKILLANSQTSNLKPVEVPEWNLTVYVRPMTVSDRDRFEKLAFEHKDADKQIPDGLRQLFLSSCCVDVEGNHIFVTDDDIKTIDTLSSSAVDRIIDVIRTVNGMDAKKDEPKAA